MQTHLFVGAPNGALYDTRSNTWSEDKYFRANYCYHHKNVASLADVKATIRAGTHTFPGGYELYAIMDEGGVMKIKTLRDNWNQVVWSHLYHISDGWRVTGFDINWEDSNLFDCHTNERIIPEYGE